MVKKADGTIEGLPKTCEKCGTLLTVVTLSVSYAWGYRDGGLVVSYKLRCLNCKPSKPYEWRKKDWQRKVLSVDGVSIDPDRIEDTLIFFKQLLPKMMRFRRIG